MKAQEGEQEQYRRVKLLGEGAYGKAFLAESVRDKSLVVVKQINMADLSGAERKQTQKEALILSKMAHPYIIQFKEVYVTKSDKLILVMEYAQGGDLAKRILDQKTSRRQFEQDTILDWFTQICLALKHVHDRKIIHRDIKGQNIFLTSNSRCKLGDFGIARALNSTLEKARTVVGTPYYLSPQIIESKPYSFASDIWSLGVLLYQMCMLKPPFSGQSLQFLALKIVQGHYEPVSSTYSMPLRNLIHSMLQLDPNRRPSINSIMHMPLIEHRIKALLTMSQRQYEFSHTILHNKHLLQSKVPIDQIGCPPKLLQRIPEKVPPTKQDKEKQPAPQKPQPKVERPSTSNAQRPVTPKVQPKEPAPISRINIRGPQPSSREKELRQQRQQRQVQPKPKPKPQARQRPPPPAPAQRQSPGGGFGSAFMNPAFQKKAQEKRLQRQKEKIKKKGPVNTSQSESRTETKMQKPARYDSKEKRVASQREVEKRASSKDLKGDRKESALRRQEQRKLMRQDIQKKRKAAGRWTDDSREQPRPQPKEQVLKVQQQNKEILKFLDSLEKEKRAQQRRREQDSPRFGTAPEKLAAEQQLFDYTKTIAEPVLLDKMREVAAQVRAQMGTSSIKKEQVAQLQRKERQMLSVIKQIQAIVSETRQKVDNVVRGEQSFNDQMFDTMPGQLQVREEEQRQQAKDNSPHLQQQVRRNIMQIRQQDADSIHCIEDNSRLEGLRARLQEELGIQPFIKAYRELEALMGEGGIEALEEGFSRDGLKAELPFLRPSVKEESVALLITLLVLENIQNALNG